MPIDPERRNDLRRAADSNFEAAGEASRAVLNLWKAQLDMAMALDDEAAVRDILRRPGGEVGLWDNNTNCGGGCGGGGGTQLW